MTSTLARSLVAAALVGLSELASAGPTPIDLLTAPGIGDTGGPTPYYGPCYCDLTAWISPIMLLAPGTYDFGTVRQYWVKADPTPDGGPDQPSLWLLFVPVETSGNWPEAFTPLPDFSTPPFTVCSPECDSSFEGLSEDVHLVFTVAPGENAIQIGLIGDYVYTPPAPVPEPATPALLALGLALVAALARRPGRRWPARRGA